MQRGYFRHPAVHTDSIVFVSEDDLWSVPLSGGKAFRLTGHLSAGLFPRFSPDGSRLAFLALEEGVPEVHLMPADGGSADRLTHLGGTANVAGWSPDGQWIYFATSAGQPVRGHEILGRVPLPGTGGSVEKTGYGRASAIAFGPEGGVLLGRNVGDPARWKRYRGGTAGQFWLAAGPGGPFARLLGELKGNPASPMWLPDPESEAGRIWFLSDHEGVGNLYSCLPSGSELRRHTHHTDFYARFATWGPSPDGGASIVYHAGADIFRYDVQDGRTRKVPIEYASPGVQLQRKFVSAENCVESVSLHPKGHSVSFSARGKAFAMGNHEGAVLQLGRQLEVRYRLPEYLHDGESLVAVTDHEGEERLQVFHLAAAGASSPADRLYSDFDFGRAVSLHPSPVDKRIALVNHRSELWLFCLESSCAEQLDRSPCGQIDHVGWAPDGRWLAYDYADSPYTGHVRLHRLAQEREGEENVPGKTVQITNPVLRDFCPLFDPKGRYLYFLSSRILNPQYDVLKFDLGFTRGMRPYLITLQADLPNPFVPRPGEDGDTEEDDKEKPAEEKPKPESEKTEDSKEDKPDEPKPLKVDLEGIQGRILPFPVPAGLFSSLQAVEDRVFWIEHEARASLPDAYGDPATEGGDLATWVFAQHKRESVAHGVTACQASADGKKLLYRTADRTRVVSASVNEDGLTDEGAPRDTGWLDLGRARVSVDAPSEWRQMLKEAWRLQRDQFWTEDMSQVDWQSVFQRYFPLVDRVGSRLEFSDLMWEMQGELGTSHAYEMGGDYRPHPDFPLGSLGADLEWDSDSGSYVVGDWLSGDSWEAEAHSPFAAPGVDVRRGDQLIAVNGQPLSAEVTPASLLVNQAGQEVQLTFRPRPDESQAESEEKIDADAVRQVTVRTLTSEFAALYRDWVETNRSRVHEQSAGRLGYLHIPDMGPRGFAEFHRGFLAEVRRQGLVVDLRFNGGGHVSELLLELLARRRLGYDQSRWQGAMAYPAESVAGPIVALTNEQAASDGDMFSHAFKLMGLGPLIGKRTWGGVIGIWPRHALVDGTVTTQPEFSIWFRDVGWGVENYGTDPDIEVEITPDDYLQGRDPQLDRAVAECSRLLEENPPLPVPPAERPSLALPTLPPAPAVTDTSA